MEPALCVHERSLPRVQPDKAAGHPGATRELVVPSATFNPALHRFFQVVQSRAVGGEGSPFPPIDPRIEASVHPERGALAERAEKAGAMLGA